MKLSRRCFLSLVVGGAAGTALSPLPWKLADDVAIWSQNWTWTPVPPDGEVSYVDSTCTLCPGGCGISVRKITNRAVKIEGREGHPINNGGICILGLSGLQLLYSPNRIQQPLKRIGNRGEGKWQPISWSEAISETAAKLADIRKQGNPQKVAALMHRGEGTVAQLMHRLLTAYGSPNFMVMPSVENTYRSALQLTQGAGGRVGLDVTQADFILSFGSALLDGYGSPVQMFHAVSRLKDIHGKLVQIEPKLSNTAAKATRWLAARPGSEGDLALAMAQVIVASGRYDQQFVGSACEGFDEFARMLNSHYTPQQVADGSGIDPQTISDTALAFANAKKPIALHGRGKGQTPGSIKEALAVHALNALVGNINHVGGVQAIPDYDYIHWPEVASDAVAAAGLKTARADDAATGLHAESNYLPNRFMENVAKGSVEMAALLVGETNPCYALHDVGTVKAAFDKIPFVVSFSSFMDETAAEADMILPNHLYLERYEDVPVTAGVAISLVGLCQPVVKPQCNTRHMGDTLIEIAKAIGSTTAEAMPWTNYTDCLQGTLSAMWSAVNREGYLTLDNGPASEAKFNTASGKFILMDKTLGAAYLSKNALIPGDESQYPLVLMPYDSIRLTSTYVADPPFMMKTLPDTVLKGNDGWVEINPETAAEKGLKEGQMAVLTTPVGQAKVRVHHNHGLRPGVIAMAAGLGHAAQDPYVNDKGINTNALMRPVEDPASGMDAAWGIQAQLAKA